MDEWDWVVAFIILILWIRFAFRAERRYQALKSTGAYENKSGYLREVADFRRGYREAEDEFIREQEENRRANK